MLILLAFSSKTWFVCCVIDASPDYCISEPTLPSFTVFSPQYRSMYRSLTETLLVT